MIRENVRRLLQEIPDRVQVVAAAKMKSPAEILEAVEAGIRIIGENYVREAEEAFRLVGDRVKWHFIGHLQRNKAKKAVEIFDMVETVDSISIAGELDRRCALKNKVMPVLIEVNSGREPQKFGVFPEEVEELIRRISALNNIRVRGLMTMGPESEDPEACRPYFRETKNLFDRMAALAISEVEMTFLSMGMTNSYRIAIEEGANMVRIGTKIFGSRRRD